MKYIPFEMPDRPANAPQNRFCLCGIDNEFTFDYMRIVLMNQPGLRIPTAAGPTAS
jgi:hypothetical protein